MAAGNEYCVIVENKRTLWGWGKNSEGQLGLGHDYNIVTKPT